MVVSISWGRLLLRGVVLHPVRRGASYRLLMTYAGLRRFTLEMGMSLRADRRLD